MSIISNNPTLQFAMPGGGVNLNAVFEPEPLLKITSAGVVSGSATLKALPDGSVDLIIPSVINGITVSSIGSFSAFKSLKSVIIPNTVTIIGGSFVTAFSGCSNLKSISIPDSVIEIKSKIFIGCTSLTTIDIPNSVRKIGDGAFGFTSLISINVDPNNAYFKSINGILFSKDGKKILGYPAGKSEKSYNIPNGVTSIGNGAFHGCSSLTSINIPDSVTSIGASFHGCSSLTSINIPYMVKSINALAFQDCTALPIIDIPSSVTFIGTSAFANCISLTSINIDKPVDSITDSPWGCPNTSAVKWLG